MPNIELQLERLPPDARPRPDFLKSPHRVSDDGPDRSLEALARTIAPEIAPVPGDAADRLQSSGRRASKPPRKQSYEFRSIDVAEFTTLAACSDCDLWLYVEKAVEAGATVEEIMEDLLAPAARRLGDMWELDDCDFLGVTTATHRLQTSVRRLSQSHGTERQGHPRALLVPAPGETHTLGLAIVRAFFEKSGWSVDLASGSGLEAAVSRQWCELVAFSISCDRFVDALTEAVALVRKASRNRRVFILVGGPVVVSNPALAARIGADAGAATPHEAVVVTRSLIRRGARL